MLASALNEQGGGASLRQAGKNSFPLTPFLFARLLGGVYPAYPALRDCAGPKFFSAGIYKKGGWAGLEKFIAITLSFTPLENHLFTLLLVFSFIIII